MAIAGAIIVAIGITATAGIICSISTRRAAGLVIAAALARICSIA
jgi:hypothetical protein